MFRAVMLIAVVLAMGVAAFYLWPKFILYIILGL